MFVLVANLGSTSFKYRLFDMADERQLARGAIERIGAAESPVTLEIGARREESAEQVPDHTAAVRICLAALTDPNGGCLENADDVAAVGFKAVHGGRFSGVQRVTPEVLDAMEEMNGVAPAHNPPYVSAMRQLAERLPEIPLVAAFETGFHETIPAANRTYAIPLDWIEKYQLRRWGFHGASHRYIAERTADLLGTTELRVISCHLGGSSSVTGIRNGQSVATSMGLSPQSGLPQNNRVGDFDPFALPLLLKHTGMTLEEILQQLACEAGLRGLSGTSGDIRDVRASAERGESGAQLALDTFIASVRQYLGWMLVELGGADVLVFTGGIGEHGADIRLAVCQGLEELGIAVDPSANQSATGEAPIHASSSRAQVWVMPTNEEIIVARQVKQLLES